VSGVCVCVCVYTECLCENKSRLNRAIRRHDTVIIYTHTHARAPYNIIMLYCICCRAIYRYLSNNDSIIFTSSRIHTRTLQIYIILLYACVMCIGDRGTRRVLYNIVCAAWY